MKLAIGVCVLALVSPAFAGHADDLAFAVQEANHDKGSGWVIERMFTFKLADKCWGKLLDKKQRGLALVATWARTVERYAKVVTGDDWPAIEGQSANSADTNRALVDKLVTAFAPKLHVTVVVDGDDCDATGNGLWLKYVGTTLSALEHYPPKAGKANITITADAKAKAVKTQVSSDGATFAIIGPRDVEVSGWPSEIEGPVKRVSTKN